MQGKNKPRIYMGDTFRTQVRTVDCGVNPASKESST